MSIDDYELTKVLLTLKKHLLFVAKCVPDVSHDCASKSCCIKGKRGVSLSEQICVPMVMLRSISQPVREN